MKHPLRLEYEALKPQIDQKWLTFYGTWEAGHEDIWSEMVMCLCTPQTKAERGWAAAKRIGSPNSVSVNKVTEILGEEGVRFKNRKALYIFKAAISYGKYSLKDQLVGLIHTYSMTEVRNLLHDEIKGFGMKEASHFMRNVGLGDEVAILDRHIVGQLIDFKVIEKPKNLNVKTYLDIEQKMISFAKEIDVPLFALDFVFWARTHNGVMFK